MFKRLYQDKMKVTTKVSVIEATAPVVIISGEAIKKIQMMVETISDEVGWFMTVFKDAQANVYEIRDVYLFEQRVHGATTEVNEQLLSDFAEELVKIPDFENIWNNIKGWGHSHVNMSVTPSGQDDSQMEFFSRTGFDFFIRVISNKKGDIKVDVYNYALGIAYHDVKIFIAPTKDEQEARNSLDALEKEYNEKKKEYEVIIKEVQNVAYKALEEEFKPEIEKKVKKFTYATNAGYRENTQLTNFKSWEGGYDGGFVYDDGYGYDDDYEDIVIVNGKVINVGAKPKTKATAKKKEKKETLRTIDIYSFLNETELRQIAGQGTYLKGIEYVNSVYPEFADMFENGFLSTIWNEAILISKKSYRID